MTRQFISTSGLGRSVTIRTAMWSTGLIACAAMQAHAADVSVGGGIQTGFYSCDNSCLYSPGTVNSATGSSVSGFALDSARLYINGSINDNIKMTLDTEYTHVNSNGQDVGVVEVMDAYGAFHFSDAVNIWAGRFLPPSDRANLYGPYYANDWTPYADGVADYYPNVAVGRDNGVAYWGDYGIAKLQIGAFDGQSLNSAVSDPSKILMAGRLTLDFWDKESGYYLNGTYYGDKNILALGIAAQSLDSKTTWSADGLLEKSLGSAGAFSFETEYNKDNGLTGGTPSDGWYGLAAYVFPEVVGVGKFQLLAKYSEKSFDATMTAPTYKLKTTEADFNYIIKSFNARVGLYYLTQKNDGIPCSNTDGSRLEVAITNVIHLLHKTTLITPQRIYT